MTDPEIIKYPFENISIYSTSYEVDFHCPNCGKNDQFRLPKGMKQKGVKVDCENCGCEGEL